MSELRPGAALRPLFALVGGAVAIGFAPIFVRWSEVGLNATAFWRLALMSAYLAGYWRKYDIKMGLIVLTTA